MNTRQKLGGTGGQEREGRFPKVVLLSPGAQAVLYGYYGALGCTFWRLQVLCSSWLRSVS